MDPPLSVHEPGSRALARGPRLARGRADRWLPDHLLHGFSLVASVVPPLLLLVFAAVMFASSYKAIRFSGLGFLTGKIFTLGNLYATTETCHNGVCGAHSAQYGIATLIAGTVLSSGIALALAVPVSVGGVMLLVERIPRRIQPLLGVFLELLAGIPSVVYGLFGIIVLGPLLARSFYPHLATTAGAIPAFRGPVGSGQGLLTASLVLAIMIVPVIAATTRDLIRSVPVLYKEGAMALGMTHFEVVRIVTLPFVRNGILAASLLGLARALGETIAVLMISGNALNIYPYNIYAPISTIAATIAAFLDAALTDTTGLGVSALAEAGFVLLLITLATNFAARMIIRRSSNTALPVGRGF